MRDKRDLKALNVAYTRDGLKWTCNFGGRLFYFRDATLRHTKVGDNSYIPYFHGDLTPSEDVIIELFEPINHVNWALYEELEKAHPRSRDAMRIRQEINRRESLQVLEYRWLDKAIRLLYTNNVEDELV